MKINILGTEWKIVEKTKSECPALEDCDGITDDSTKTIFVEKMEQNGDPLLKGNLKEYEKQVVRHEIVHTFMSESGLTSNWEHPHQFGQDETTVDWFAI